MTECSATALKGFERSTPFSVKASTFNLTPSGFSLSAHELIKLELMSFVQAYLDGTDMLLLDDAMQLEVCRVIFATETSYD